MTRTGYQWHEIDGKFVRSRWEQQRAEDLSTFGRVLAAGYQDPLDLQDELRALCRKQGVSFTTAMKLAKSLEYGVNPAQATAIVTALIGAKQ